MSNLTLEVYDAPTAEWDQFADRHPQQKLYHRREWHQLITDTFGHPTRYLLLRNSSGVRAVLPLTRINSLLFGHIAVSLPFINYGGPLAADAADAAALVEQLHGYLTDEKLKLIELRLDSELPTDLPCRRHKVTFMLDLPESADELLASFKAKVRSQIRRPTKDGMYAKTGGVELLEDFYHVFTVNMRDLGTPVLPEKFFRRILETFPEEAFISSVYTSDHRVAAASFLIRYKDTLEIPWASSLREYNRSSPNMLLYWESMTLGIHRQCRHFDFGRCTPGEGTYKFKKQWGAREIPLFWYYVLPEGEALPEMNPNNPRYQLMIRLWQKMPLPLTKLIGPFVIKHIP